MNLNIGWLIFIALFTVVWFVTMCALVYNRNHNFIKFRNFPLLIVQCVGLLVTTTMNALYVGLKPNYSCYATYVGTLLIFASFAVPFTLRCWEYGVNFHVAKARTKFRDSVPNPEKIGTGELLNNWFVNNRWCVNPKLLIGIYILGFPLWFIPLIFYGQNLPHAYNEETGGCAEVGGSNVVAIVFFLLFVLIAFFLAFLMYGSRDVYYVKNELIGMAVTWAIIFLVWVPYFSFNSVQRKLSATTFPILGFCFSFLWNAVFPLFLVHKFPSKGSKERVESAQTYKNFVNTLADAQFRNKFHDFLAKQFCQENILFYEVVTEWKNNRNDSQSRYIFNNYINEGAVCQINITSEQVEAIKNSLSQPTIPESIFDDALTTIMDMMYANSYLPFSRQLKLKRGYSSVTLEVRT